MSILEKSCIFAVSTIRALDGQVGGRQDIIKDVERNVLSAAYRTSQLRNLCRTVKQQPSSIGALYMILMYSRQRGLRHCLSSTKGQCEGLIRGMSDELRYPRFFFMPYCNSNNSALRVSGETKPTCPMVYNWAV